MDSSLITVPTDPPTGELDFTGYIRRSLHLELPRSKLCSAPRPGTHHGSGLVMCKTIQCVSHKRYIYFTMRTNCMRDLRRSLALFLSQKLLPMSGDHSRKAQSLHFLWNARVCMSLVFIGILRSQRSCRIAEFLKHPNASCSYLSNVKQM